MQSKPGICPHFLCSSCQALPFIIILLWGTRQTIYLASSECPNCVSQLSLPNITWAPYLHRFKLVCYQSEHYYVIFLPLLSHEGLCRLTIQYACVCACYLQFGMVWWQKLFQKLLLDALTMASYCPHCYSLQH